MRRLSKRVLIVLLAGGLFLGGASSIVLSHCEIPCGIYGDPMRLDMMAGGEELQPVGPLGREQRASCRRV